MLFPYQIKESRWERAWFSLIPEDRMDGAIIIPFTLSSAFCRVSIKSSTASPNWWLAGYLEQYVSNESEEMMVNNWKLPLNKMFIIKANDFTEEYYLSFTPVDWLKAFSITVDYLKD